MIYKRLSILPLLLMQFLAISQEVRADLVISVLESGADVELTYSGTLDLSDLSFTTINSGELHGFENLFGGDVWLNAFTGSTLNAYDSPFSSAPTDFFSTGGAASTFSGDHIFVGGQGVTLPLRLRTSAVTNDVFTGSGAQTFSGTDFAGLGLTEGASFVWTLDNTAANTITLNVGACLLYTSPSPRDQRGPRMPSSA